MPLRRSCNAAVPTAQVRDESEHCATTALRSQSSQSRNPEEEEKPPTQSTVNWPRRRPRSNHQGASVTEATR
eukprot:15447420-Alexandrium_andersonii.AAC.1